jgi:hypothetical protein
MPKLSLAAPMVLLLACSLPDLSKLRLADCVRGCTAGSECLRPAKVSCPLADACFDGMQACFDAATRCTDKCADCDKLGTCASETKCLSDCSHHANECTKLIDACTDHLQGCGQAQTDGARACVTSLLECVSGCVADAERELRR